MSAEYDMVRELKNIRTELHELNRKLDRLCNAEINSIAPPRVILPLEDEDDESSR